MARGTPQSAKSKQQQKQKQQQQQQKDKSNKALNTTNNTTNNTNSKSATTTGRPPRSSSPTTSPKNNNNNNNNNNTLLYKILIGFLGIFEHERSWVGIILTINFLVFWAAPIAIQGQVWKLGLRYILHPIWAFFDNSTLIRGFATNWIYTKKQASAYFVTSVFTLLSAILMVYMVFKVQLTTGTLPWWLIIAYYFAWVGFGGRTMGGAYAMAHKEGHNQVLYRPWVRNTIGNIFENWLGYFFGNVPYNFTTSHIAIHHRLNAGLGDTFYQWDLDRTSWSDFMLFLHRILMHTSGASSLKFFAVNNMPKNFNRLIRGVIGYWFIVPTMIYAITRSFSFLFFIYLQPFFCMTYFLAFLNYGFHAFFEKDEKGDHVWCVNSIAIVGGDDDYFGEDDHMLHHNAAQVFFTDLDDYRKTKYTEFRTHKASLFTRLSILELSLYVLLKDYKKLAEHYLDVSNSLSKDEIAEMLKTRAQRLEMSHEDYHKWRQTHSKVFGRNK